VSHLVQREPKVPYMSQLRQRPLPTEESSDDLEGAFSSATEGIGGASTKATEGIEGTVEGTAGREGTVGGEGMAGGKCTAGMEAAGVDTEGATDTCFRIEALVFTIIVEICFFPTQSTTAAETVMQKNLKNENQRVTSVSESTESEIHSLHMVCASTQYGTKRSRFCKTEYRTFGCQQTTERNYGCAYVSISKV
jgi:hypothetical protein